MEIEKIWLKIIYDEVNQEEIPDNTQDPLGKPMLVYLFVDEIHAG